MIRNSGGTHQTTPPIRPFSLFKHISPLHHSFLLKEKDMGFEFDLNLNSQAGEFVKETVDKISDSKQVNGSQQSSSKADSFVVDMERFPQLIEKDANANSRITRNLSRKVSMRGGGEKFFNSTAANEKDANILTTSPKVSTLHEGSTLEKPMLVALGATDHSIVPQVHHHITITDNTSSAAESKLGGKRFSFRRSPHSCSIDPRRILFFFATLSSVGTILLIYFTLSMSKFNGDTTDIN